MSVNEVIVYSDRLEDHLEHVHRVLMIVRGADLVLNKAKCYFSRTSVEYLGPTVIFGRFEVAEKNTSSIKQKNPQHLRLSSTAS